MVLIARDWVGLGNVPKNADCAWSTSSGFWRSSANAACNDKIKIYSNRDVYEFNCLTQGWCCLITITGGWLAAPVGDFCAGSDSYIIQDRGVIYLDIWKALADGMWSSSVVFTVYADMQNNPSALTTTLAVGPETASLPSVQNIGPLSMFVIGSICATYARATLTIYDDGTFTYA